MSLRRQQILDTAAGLFAERGFHGVSVNDIGGALGISGPALYKHFEGKGALLAACLTQVSAELLREGRSRVAAAADPEAALASLIEWHADFAVSQPALIVVQEREWGNLAAEARDEVRRQQLAYIDLWTDTLREVRAKHGDTLPTAEGRAAIQAVFGLLNSTPHSARISRPAMRALLITMAHAALRLAAPDE
ncbi:TetR/AcrR family transcriptional regulator [Nocardioides limicola]|uniref:TetR/AcrR family transcriptional regulator n=1 Tax=Nocardioides limicola TaxID=2803368 RepID=UPI00193C488A|nr:TetR/AcrR family transcriptional regulator [Nocardioides sp. DJM-14]